MRRNLGMNVPAIERPFGRIRSKTQSSGVCNSTQPKICRWLSRPALLFSSQGKSTVRSHSDMRLAAVARCLFALGHAVVTQDGGHTQAIVEEYVLAAVGLNI